MGETSSRLAVHTQTFRKLTIEQAAGLFLSRGLKGISVWRNVLEGKNIAEVADFLKKKDLEVVSLVRGGFFPHHDPSERRLRIRKNLEAIEEARQLGAPLLVMVCGADPAQSPEENRRQIAEGIEQILPFAEQSGIRLGIEPLHPMYADTRSAINTLGQANDLAARMDSDYLGVVVDVYHLWWEPALEQEIARCGAMNRLFAFHVSDWKVPTLDMLEDRGLMGEGCIDIKGIRKWVEQAGFKGYIEVEIFSKTYWEMEPSVFMDRIIRAYHEQV